MWSLYRMARQVSRLVGPDSLVSRAARPLAEPLIRWTSGHRGLEWEINGTPCRIDPRFRAQLARNYDATLAAELKQAIKPGQVCLDVGANIGAWVIQMGRWVGPAGRVVAFEPNPEARAVLERHIRLNGLQDRTTVVHAAVGGATRSDVPFFAAGVDGMSRIGEPNPLLGHEAKPITVPLVTLDDWSACHPVAPDWMLIDVEGLEGHVLAGAKRLIGECGPALGIIVEMHPSLWSASGTTTEDLAAIVAALGRRAVPLTGQANPFTDYGHVRLEPL